MLSWDAVFFFHLFKNICIIQIIATKHHLYQNVRRFLICWIESTPVTHFIVTPSNTKSQRKNHTKLHYCSGCELILVMTYTRIPYLLIQYQIGNKQGPKISSQNLSIELIYDPISIKCLPWNFTRDMFPQPCQNTQISIIYQSD